MEVLLSIPEDDIFRSQWVPKFQLCQRTHMEKNAKLAIRREGAFAVIRLVGVTDLLLYG